jgi:hypothetical protein
MTGHIRRRGERSWELKFDLGRDETGKRQIRYHSFKGTKREAQAELTRLSAEALHGTYIDATSETVGGFLDRWDRDWASIHLSPKTVERYRGIIGKQIKPNIALFRNCGPSISANSMQNCCARTASPPGPLATCTACCTGLSVTPQLGASSSKT